MDREVLLGGIGCLFIVAMFGGLAYALWDHAMNAPTFASEVECDRALAGWRYNHGHLYDDFQRCVELARGGWCAMTDQPPLDEERCFLP